MTRPVSRGAGDGTCRAEHDERADAQTRPLDGADGVLLDPAAWPVTAP